MEISTNQLKVIFKYMYKGMLSSDSIPYIEYDLLIRIHNIVDENPTDIERREIERQLKDKVK